jgi:hypothetical protein
MAKTPKPKHSTLHKVVATLVDTLGKSGHLEKKSVEKLSDMLANPGAYGCCTFVMAGQTFHSNMTQQNCSNLNGSWSPNPC